jgi:hypothetical protein
MASSFIFEHPLTIRELAHGDTINYTISIIPYKSLLKSENARISRLCTGRACWAVIRALARNQTGISFSPLVRAVSIVALLALFVLPPHPFWGLQVEERPVALPFH